MPLALYALTAGAFGIGVTEFVIMGLLREVGADMGVSIATAGLLISGYALGVVFGAPTLTILTGSWPRKTVLSGLMLIFIVGNVICALAPTYEILMAARIVTALAHGTFFGVGSVVATNLVPEPNAAVRLARAASEAGLVGGIADWFAVTALFRRPLGLPIPHTAIIPRSKDRIADSLADFIEQHFLSPEVIAAKLKEVRAGQRLGGWLSQPENAALVADAVVKALPYAIRTIGSSELRTLLDRTMGDKLRDMDVAPLLAKALRALSNGRELDELVDKGVEALVAVLEENKPEIEKAIRARSQWWIPGIVDKPIAKSLVEGLTDVVAKVREPDSDGRKRIRQAIDEFIDSLETSDERRAAVARIKANLLEHEDVKAWIASLWTSASDAAIADLESEQSSVRTAVENGLLVVGRMVSEDASMQGQVDRAIERVGLYMVSWRSEIGRFFSDVVRNWDARTLTQRLEAAVGSDLQYIRMNGTVVGAIVGCVLFAVTSLLH